MFWGSIAAGRCAVFLSVMAIAIQVILVLNDRGAHLWRHF